MTTYTVCCVAHSDVENQVTMQPGFQPEVIDTFACREMAADRVATWSEEDGEIRLYYISEGRRPVTIWP
jgi:hypothetical protein